MFLFCENLAHLGLIFLGMSDGKKDQEQLKYVLPKQMLPSYQLDIENNIMSVLKTTKLQEFITAYYDSIFCDILLEA